MDDLTGIKLELVANHLLLGHSVKVKADGHSMNPFIKKGDILTVKGIINDQLHPGEMVAFIRNELLFIHRILEAGRADGMVLTKGDNLLISDKLSKSEEIIGRVIAINDTSVTSRSPIHRLFFQLYRFCLLAGNSSNTIENQGIIQLSISPFRFRISRIILRVYRFFVFQ